MNEPLWWPSLRHGGLLLSASRLAELFPNPAAPLSLRLIARLRADVLRVADRPDDTAASVALLDTVLHNVAGLQDATDARWQRGSQVEPRFARRSITGEIVKPRRVWRGPRGAVLPVFFDEEPRLGIGRGRRAISRVLEWCRGTGHSLALLTNARQFRLCYVAAEHDAWAQWDTSLWFEQGVPSFQVEALCHLLAPRVHIPPGDDQPAPLLDAIRASRQGQSQLTSLLGERVRQAVELLIDAHSPHLRAQPDLPRPDIYRAATLVVMRLVVSLFAEARDLFPRSNRIYEASYGLQGLREKLHRAAGGNPARLRSRHGSWPQVLALFRLVYAGSPHDELSLRAYGGELFRPGRADDHEAVRRAMHLFENAALAGDPPAMNDADVLTLLELLTRCAVPVRQGRSVTTVTMPVDFADLSTEYIGILYEGLLDYELNQVPPASTDPILFINLGDQPALPLSRLEALDGAALRDFFKEFRKKQGLSTGGDDAGDDAGEDTEGDDDDAGDALDTVTNTDAGGAVEETAALDAADPAMEAKQRALAWARRAVVETKLVRAYTGNDPGRRAEAEERIGRAANQLLARPPVLPGEYFLVRWGGTRKGQGSFYTRPGLVEPTVRRTLAPLCYDLPAEPSAEDLRDPQSPKPPAAILALKVGDISMGSASFLVSALRYLTDALWRSLLHHQWIVAADPAFQPGPGLPAGEPPWFRECVRDLPMEHAAAENTIRARLKRLIVERCLYGVDLDPLAVEIARLSLWVETMDRDLPFGFLDHKLKCGNGLVGCWFDRFRDFPALCLHRPQDDAGDKTHATAVHNAKGRLSDAQKEFRDTVLKPALVHWIESRDPSVFAFLADGQTTDDLHATALRLFEEMHAMPLLTEEDVEARAIFYHDRVEPALAQLREAFDIWCALWFWPAEHLSHFPLPEAPPSNLPTAAQAHSGVTWTELTPAARQIVADLRARLRFFHWEIEFPDVFAIPGSGFDALLGNPPWENLQPNPREYFSNHDPLFRTYGRLHSLEVMRRIFEIDGAEESRWIKYIADFKSFSNWVSNISDPTGLGASDEDTKVRWLPKRLRDSWRTTLQGRRSYADSRHPFTLQVGRLFSYRLFVEMNLRLLRNEGRLGVIVPSAIYTDGWTATIRSFLLDGCRWEWLFGFENREKLFDIDSRFKFCVLIAEKGLRTSSIRTAFMRRKLSDWDQAEQHAVSFSREQITEFSPRSNVILEIRTSRDTEILQKLYTKGELLGSGEWNLCFALEFMMNTHANLFPPLPSWQEKGYIADEYCHWLRGRWLPWSGPRGCRSVRGREPGLILSRDGARCIRIEEIDDIALPLYEGRMIDHFDFSAKGWISGKGRGSVWREIPWDDKVIEPQYLMGKRTRDGYELDKYIKAFSERHGNEEGAREAQRLATPERWSSWRNSRWPKLAFMDVTSATNARTMVSTLLPDVPCGNSCAVLRNPSRTLALASVTSSLFFDFVARLRCGGLHLNYFVIDETALPKIQSLPVEIERNARRLLLGSPIFAELWEPVVGRSWYTLWALSELERLRLQCLLNAIVGWSFNVSWADAIYMLKDCDYSRRQLGITETARSLDPKGFWRVDNDKDPELRHTVLSLVAFHDLQRMGLEAFLAQNDGEGWMLPETLRLADYGLGHDDRAREPQPVASRLGPRFFPWQLEGTVEESWEECRRHAANLRAIRSFGAPAAPPLADNTIPATDLFGNEIPSVKRRSRRSSN